MPGTDSGDGKAGDRDYHPGPQQLAWLLGVKGALFQGAASKELRGGETHPSPVGHRLEFLRGPGTLSNEAALQISAWLAPHLLRGALMGSAMPHLPFPSLKSSEKTRHLLVPLPRGGSVGRWPLLSQAVVLAVPTVPAGGTGRV